MNQKFLHQLLFSKVAKVSNLLLVALLLFPIGMKAQGIKVKEMKRVLSDLSASIHQRQDSTGIPCGLVKVLSSANIAVSGKHVVGAVNSKLNEYWVYMPPKSKEITIKRESYLPVTIKFADYGVDEIESKVTYQLTLKESALNEEKNGVVINVKPQFAKLSIDKIDLDVQNSGNYKLILDKGEHICRVESNGYKPSVSIINAGKGVQTLDIELESLMAIVDVSCETSNSDIYINNEFKGIGNWAGSLPAGEYNVEAKMEGYVSYSQKLILNEKETKKVQLPKLKRNIINLVIKTNPEDCCMRKIYIDGHLVCTDSLCSVEVYSGKHELMVEAVGCKPKKQAIDIKSKQSDTISIDLAYIDGLYGRAYKGYVDEQFEFGESAFRDFQRGRKSDKNLYYQAKYWFTKAIHNPNAIKSSWLRESFNRAEVINFFKKEGFPQELITLAKLLDKIPRDNENIHFEIAECYECALEYENALIHYKKYYDFYKDEDDDLGFVLSRIGTCYHKLKNDEQAKTYLLKAKDPEALGDFYWDIDDKKQAIYWYRKRLDMLIDQNYGNTIKEFVKKMKEKGLYDDVLSGKKISLSILNGYG